LQKDVLHGTIHSMKKVLLVAVVALLLVGTTGVVYAKTYHLFTMHGFVEELISRGVIPSILADKARELARAAQTVEDIQEEKDTAPNAEHVSVSASQLIEYGTRTYAEGDDIQGLLLLVKSNHDEMVALTAKRKCQVVYAIFNADDEKVYDSSAEPHCVDAETVTWYLKPGDTRMFRVEHAHEITYPGYGSDTRTVTVQ
jgi:hypothetical protein